MSEVTSGPPTGSTPLEPTVRRCAACGEPAMVCVSRYQRAATFGLLPLGPSGLSDVRAFVCQRCGDAFTVHPVPWLWIPGAVLGAGIGLLGVLAALVYAGDGAWFYAFGVGGLLIGTGFGLVGTVAWPIIARIRRPVVARAAVPEVHLREVHPPRRCACGREARCVKVEASRVNGIYVGTDHRYTCASCGASFEVESPLSAGVSVAGGLFLLWVAAILAPTRVAELQWKDLMELAVAGLGVGLLAKAVFSFAARIRHPTARRRT